MGSCCDTKQPSNEARPRVMICGREYDPNSMPYQALLIHRNNDNECEYFHTSCELTTNKWCCAMKLFANALLVDNESVSLAVVASPSLGEAICYVFDVFLSLRARGIAILHSALIFHRDSSVMSSLWPKIKQQDPMMMRFSEIETVLRLPAFSSIFAESARGFAWLPLPLYDQLCANDYLYTTLGRRDYSLSCNATADSEFFLKYVVPRLHGDWLRYGCDSASVSLCLPLVERGSGILGEGVGIFGNKCTLHNNQYLLIYPRCAPPPNAYPYSSATSRSQSPTMVGAAAAPATPKSSSPSTSGKAPMTSTSSSRASSVHAAAVSSCAPCPPALRRLASFSSSEKVDSEGELCGLWEYDMECDGFPSEWLPFAAECQARLEAAYSEQQQSSSSSPSKVNVRIGKMLYVANIETRLLSRTGNHPCRNLRRRLAPELKVKEPAQQSQFPPLGPMKGNNVALVLPPLSNLLCGDKGDIDVLAGEPNTLQARLPAAAPLPMQHNQGWRSGSLVLSLSDVVEGKIGDADILDGVV